MRRHRFLRKAALVSATLVLAAASATGAWAFLTIAGGGTGSVSVGTAQAVTFSTATPTTALYPGDAADIALTVSNPTGGNVFIPSLQLDTTQGTNGFTVDGSHSGCDVGDLTFTADGTGWTVPANTAAYPIHLPGAVSMSTSAANACQGAVFTIYLKVGP